MPPICTTAIITNGATVLFKIDAGQEGVTVYALPCFPFSDDEDSIEESLSRQLLQSLGIQVREQEFIETLYERLPGSAGTTLNNLQFVTEWEGSPSERSVSGGTICWVAFDALDTLNLSPDLLGSIQATLGLAIGGPSQPVGAVEQGRILVITGPAGAGKSTVARRLCESLPRSALISLDQLWHSVVSGGPVPRWSGGDPHASDVFELLALQQAGGLARGWSGGNYDTVIDGVLEEPRHLDTVLAASGHAPVYFITLMPSSGVLQERDSGRPVDNQMGERSQELHSVFMQNGEFRGLHLDSSELSAEETARLIFEHLDEARVR